MNKSKTAAALVLVANGVPVYQAAKAVGISPSGVYTRMRQAAQKQLCPYCGNISRTPK